MSRKNRHPRSFKKKSSREEGIPALEKDPYLRDSLGLFLIFFSFFLFLALYSHVVYGPEGNYLGFLGTLVSSFHYMLFGAASFLLPLVPLVLGVEMILEKNREKQFATILFFLLSISSLCLLLTVFEDSYPYNAHWIKGYIYPFFKKKLHAISLGGEPARYLYLYLPIVGLKHLLSATGVALISVGIFATSFCYLFRVPLKVVVEKAIFGLKSIFEEQKPIEPSSIPEGDVVEFIPDEARFVELRLPSSGVMENKERISIQPKDTETLKMLSQQKANIQEKERERDFSSIEKIEKEEILPIIPLPKVREKRDITPKVLKKVLKDAESQKRVTGAPGEHPYLLPKATLLTTPKKQDLNLVKKDLKKQAEILEETLLSFGIEAKVGQINCGPTITSFEVHPSIGVKVQKIKTLENDIALNMQAKSIRIIAPIPGKAAVGIEVPNTHPQEVGFKDMLEAYQGGNKKFHLPVLLGKAVNGDYVMSDLAKMPHCIIAGATGSGKSVCINTIVMSLVMNLSPEEVRLVMVDPKKVELTPYNNLPHMIAPVITEPHGAAKALQWLVAEMEMRYEVLKQIGVRNIEAFNQRKRNIEKEEELSIAIPEKFPYFVLIIDEMADLMMVSGSHDIETPTARLAQMARAIGIHVILATQRPSREVITGLIKANFPTRISFKVASRVNSQIVIDDIGGESLLGNGDMLFLPPGSAQLIRAQGAYIRDEDIHTVLECIQEQYPTKYLVESFDHMLPEDVVFAGQKKKDNPQLEQAIQIVREAKSASTTFLQRKMSIGYATAARLMDQLEEMGIVGPQESGKPRQVFEEHLDEIF